MATSKIKIASRIVVFFDLDAKILYLEPKHTFKEIKMVRNKHQEDSIHG